ncbi:ABC transporter ATP-binding protein [Amaricoccus solimangrovi]|uniref:ABC transporter ATP-binding protein n=1 Tax=Amaricoccus solimangrovi TaxID=2589815 RepID=A0A501WH01_9RHOB|nr:ABC transporter ATP-binding protein [Amaricoccus solimangrovi]TPE48062.1 ABC transporter ATP-binding protein [Amaricoccus solimangrovi]
MISITNASCVFRHASGREVRALDRISSTIGDGEFVCLLGRSGHGKSTLLRSLAGLNTLTAGEIAVDGRPVKGPGIDRGMVFQEDTVFPWMTVQANVEFGLLAQGIPAAERQGVAREWLDKVGLGRFGDSWPKELSGGMRKRVAIATAFAGGAPILLMDEPFGPLDYVTRRDLQNLLIDLWRSTGRTIIFVTHDIEEALVLAERALVLRAGRIVDDIRVDLTRPRDEEERASPRGIAISKTILGHLELEQHTPGAA